jgi:hypothetical protein
MKATRYFQEQVMRKRPYTRPELCQAVLVAPLRRSVQPNGRIRWWGRVIDPGDGHERILRVVTLDDGETLHNAFFDRGFREQVP